MSISIKLGPLDVEYHPEKSASTSEGHLDQEIETAGFPPTNQQDSLRRIDMALPGGRAVKLFLHWSDGTDTQELDRRITRGEDFEELLRGALVGSAFCISCTGCGDKFNAVVADTGNPLLEDIQTRLRNHSFVTNCPSCSAKLQPHIMHILARC